VGTLIFGRTEANSRFRYTFQHKTPKQRYSCERVHSQHASSLVITQIFRQYNLRQNYPK